MTLENLFSTLLITCFAWVNLVIAYQDYKIKKIKNMYLLILIFLLPFFYYFYEYHFNQVFFINITIFISVLLSLYTFHVIPPGDVKYMIVLSLFIPTNLPLFFGFITIVVLWKIVWNYFIFLLERRKQIFLFKHVNLSKTGVFFIVFLNSFLFTNLISYYLKIYFPIIFTQLEYLLFYLLFIIFFITIIKKIYSYCMKKFQILQIFFFKNIIYFLCVLLFFGNIILIFKTHLQYGFFHFVQIFMIFWALNFLIKSFTLMFQQNEEKFIPIFELQEGDIVDKDFLYHIFWQYKSINDYLIEKWEIQGQGFFKNFSNPITWKTREKILRIYLLVHQKNSEEKNGYTQIERIKIFQTFWFWPYILMAFILFFIYKFCFYFIS